MKHPAIPKGTACALHLTKEFIEGYNNLNDENPYDFFDQYEQNYAWCIGNQKGKRDESERKLRRVQGLPIF